MATRLFDRAFLKDSDALDFIANILESSTEYSIIGKDLDGQILLWNQGASRIYGYRPDEVVGKANSAILHVPEDVDAGVHKRVMEQALRDGKFEGRLERMRKNGTRFTANVVITPRRNARGDAIGFLLISKDVSDEIRMAGELEATQSYTRSLIESNIDALAAIDPVGVITDVNEQMVALTGVSREKLIGTPFKNCFTDPTRAEEGIRRTLREGNVTDYELTVHAVSGSERVVSYNASIYRDDKGRLMGVFASARDITERRRADSELRQSEERFRTFVEHAPAAVVIVDESGSIVLANAEVEQMFGYDREELLGQSVEMLIPERFHETHTRHREDYVESPDARPMGRGLDLFGRRKDGTEFSVDVSLAPMPTSESILVAAGIRDTTDRVQTESGLREEVQYSRGLIEASLEGLITVDPLLAITDVNEAMCNMSGYSREELVGSEFPKYFGDPKHAAAGVRLTLDQGFVTNYELALNANDGAQKLVSFNAAVFKDARDEVRGIFASARDITEQARLQTQLAEEQAYNRGLIEASVDGLVTVSEELTITDVNETMCRLAGRTRNQLIGSSFAQYFTEPALAEQGVRLTFSEGLVTNYVLTLESADGHSVPVSFNAAVFRDATDAVRGIFASARDITEQQELEQQLRASEFYTRSLIESNIDALMTTDPVGVITDVNDQMVALTGVPRETLVGSPFKGYFTDAERAEEGIRLTLRQGKVTNYELTARAADGRETVVSYNAATFNDRDGNLQGVFAAAREVTEQKRLEEQLREQQTYLRGLIESSVDGLVTVDPDGFITDVNDRLCEMTGYGRAELIGTPFTDYFTDPDRARDGVGETFETGFVTEYALTLISRTRRLLNVSFNASVFRDEEGNVRGIFASARDITDRVRLEEQLREQQTYLRGLIEASVDGLVTVDPEGFITDVNEQLCRMSGFARTDLIGSPFKGYFTEPDHADIGVKRTFAEGVATNYQLVLVTKNGRKTVVSFNASVYRSADGRPEGIFASARDISEQARLQGQLVEQQAYNRSLIEASVDALFAISPDGTVTDVNEEATRLTGYSRQHLTNSRFKDYFTEPELARAGVEETLSEGRVIGYELVLVTRSGRRVAVSFNAGVFTDAAGAALGILAAARDSTRQKELEQQLRDSQHYTRSIIESNIDAMATTDPLGIITDVNEQMEALTGATRDELITAPFKNYFTDPDLAEDGVRHVLRDGKVTNYELTARSRDGHETVVSYNAATFYDRDGNLQGVVAAARDVTERKAFEEALQEKNIELEAASLAKDRFLASMSHELRTPLNAIIGFTGTLLMGLPGPLNEEQETQLKTVQSSGRHLLAIINDLLDLAKIESGKVEVEFRPIVCQDVLDELTSGLRPLAAEKGLELVTSLPDEDVVIMSDQRALNQVLINLANNAIKFTDKGSICLGITSVVDDGSRVTTFKVTDTGPGIGDVERARLFEAFQRGSNVERQEGTGLGLYISQRLAELLGGTITLESEVGRGSTFALVLMESA